MYRPGVEHISALVRILPLPLPYPPLDNTPRHFTSLHYISLHYTTLHYTTLHYTTLHYISLHYTTFHFTTLHYTTLHYTTLHYTTPPLPHQKPIAKTDRILVSKRRVPFKLSTAHLLTTLLTASHLDAATKATTTNPKRGSSYTHTFFCSIFRSFALLHPSVPELLPQGCRVKPKRALTSNPNCEALNYAALTYIPSRGSRHTSTSPLPASRSPQRAREILY